MRRFISRRTARRTAHRTAHRTARRTALIASLLVASAFAWIACKSTSPSPTEGAAGRVVAIDGEATVASEGEAERLLAIGDEVRQRDRVRAAKGAEIEIRLAHNGASLRLTDGASQVVAESAAWKAPRSIAGEALSGEIVDPSLSAGRSGDRESGSDPSSAAPQEPPNQGASTEAVVGGTPGGQDTTGTTSASEGESKAKATAAASSELDNESSVARDDDADADSEKVRSLGFGDESKTMPMKPGTVRARTVKPTKNRGAVRSAVAKRSRAVGRCLLAVERPVTFRATFSIGKGGAVSKLAIEKHGLEPAPLDCVRRALELGFAPKLAGTSVVVDGDFKQAAE